METARTLHHASLPLSFLLEATNTAMYLINYLPTKTLDMHTPYFRLYHKHASYSNLRTFSCLCFPWTTFNRQNKLDTKSHQCIFLGYSINHKGYQFYNPKTKKLIISRHVIFHEQHFIHDAPFQTQPPSTITPNNPYIPPLLLQPAHLHDTPNHNTPNTNNLPPTTKTPIIKQYQRRTKPTTHTTHKPIAALQSTTSSPPTKPTLAQPTNTTSHHPMITRSKALQPNINPTIHLTQT